MENLPLTQEAIPEVVKPEHMDGKIMDSMSKLVDLKKKAEAELNVEEVRVLTKQLANDKAEMTKVLSKIEDLEIHGYSAKSEREYLDILKNRVMDVEDKLTKI